GIAGRHRHAGGTGGANDLAATRPPLQAGAARQHRRLLGTLAVAAVTYARHRIYPPNARGRYFEGRTDRGHPAAVALGGGARDGWHRETCAGSGAKAVGIIPPLHSSGNVTASIRLPSGS